MAKFIDLTGQTFNRLTVIRRAEQSAENSAQFLCQCACGTDVVVRAAFLKSGHTKSCGCHKRDGVVQRNRRNATHGHCGTKNSRTYQVWANMHYRCSNPKAQQYPNYGGRGIAVSERWKSFADFLADMGEQPPGKSIDRIDNNGNYEPGNCRWATPAEQSVNKRAPVRTEAGKKVLAANLIKARAAKALRRAA